MSTAVAPNHRQPNAPAAPSLDDASILDLVLDQHAPPVCREIEKRLRKSIRRLEELLPTSLKPHAAQLAKRALLTFSRNSKLQECTPDSFMLCVLQAAEYGLAIDGRLAHAVPYWNRQKQCSEAQFQADYKGIITAAKAKGVIRNATGAVVYAGDHFEHGQFDHGPHLEHSWRLDADRGKKLGVWAKVVFPDNTWDYTVATMVDIHRIRDRGKCRDKQGNLTGPWLTDEDAMAVKTVLKRLLKTAGLGPDIGGLLDHDDPDDDRPVHRQQTSRTAPPPATPAPEPQPARPAAATAPEPAATPDADEPPTTEPTWADIQADSIARAHGWAALATLWSELYSVFRDDTAELMESAGTLMEAWAARVLEMAGIAQAKHGPASALKWTGNALKLVEAVKATIPSDLYETLHIRLIDGEDKLKGNQPGKAPGQMFNDSPPPEAAIK